MVISRNENSELFLFAKPSSCTSSSYTIPIKAFINISNMQELFIQKSIFDNITGQYSRKRIKAAIFICINIGSRLFSIA